jgi:RNA polymerase sigma-70 factor, ECF subfamily
MNELAKTSHGTELTEDVEAVLRDIIDRAQCAYPTLDLPPDVFVTYVAKRLPADVSAARALRQLHTTDLYLACACARGDVRAFAAFDARCLSRLDRVLISVGVDADACAEIKQEIRSRVLVGDGSRAEIEDFSGRGDLRGWVRVMAVRQALRRLGRARREVSLEDDDLVQRIVESGNPELEYAKGLYRREFQRAFESALRALPDRARTLLRQHYVDGLTIDELGRLYRVHRATAARLLLRARVLVLETTRAQMRSELAVPSRELDSILQMIRSQIEVNLCALQRRRRR